MSDYFDFTIATSKGKEKRIQVTNPNLTLGKDSINTALSSIVSGNIFEQTDGFLTNAKKAQSVTVVTTKLF